LFFSRIQDAIDQVKLLTDDVNSEEIAIIGYCFGGSAVVLYSLSGGTDAKVGQLFQLVVGFITDLSAYLSRGIFLFNSLLFLSMEDSMNCLLPKVLSAHTSLCKSYLKKKRFNICSLKRPLV
jgi:hypothetical protein